jgi:NADH dehydrogenase [ubiquinone] 1 alpha subcomplex assembly factor 1
MPRVTRLVSRWLAVVFLAVSVLTSVTSVLTSVSAQAASTRLFSFGGPPEPSWQVVNDGVMGGVSTSKVTSRKGMMRFAGTVSLENNGGFASVRSPSLAAAVDDLFAAGGRVALRIRGSSTPLQITMQTADGWFWAEITPNGSWRTVVLPYSSFRPRSRFGEAVSGPPFGGQPVDRVGLLISNKKAERFWFELDHIDVLPPER